MYQIPATPLAQTVINYESFGTSGAKTTLMEFTLPTLYANGLVTKSYKNHFNFFSFAERMKSFQRLMKVLSEHLKKTNPYLISELEIPMGADPLAPNPEYALITHKPGIFILPLNSTRVRGFIPILPAQTHTQAISEASWVREALIRYGRKLQKACLAEYRPDPLVCANNTPLELSVGVGVNRLSPRDGPYSVYTGLSFEFDLDTQLGFPLFMMAIRDVKSVVKVLRTLLRLRVRENRILEGLSPSPSLKGPRAVISGRVTQGSTQARRINPSIVTGPGWTPTVTATVYTDTAGPTTTTTTYRVSA